MPMPQKWWIVAETVTLRRTYRVSAPTKESAILSAQQGEDEKPDVVEIDGTEFWDAGVEGKDAFTKL